MSEAHDAGHGIDEVFRVSAVASGGTTSMQVRGARPGRYAGSVSAQNGQVVVTMLLVTAAPSETLPSLAEKNSWPERWQIFPVGNPRSLPSGFDVSLKNTLLPRAPSATRM